MSEAWHSTLIPPRSGTGLRLAAGALLRVVDVEGGQSGDLFAVAADDVADGLSNGRTFDLAGALAPFGVAASAVSIAFNFFMNVTIAADGHLTIGTPTSQAGQGTVFAAERDLLVAVTSCAAPGCNGGAARPIRIDVSSREQ